MKTIQLCTIFMNLSFCATVSFRPALALAPSENEVLVLRASGTMWGATENTFSNHAFSLKSCCGVVLWHDSQPDVVILLNPENKTFFKESLSKFISGNHYGVRRPFHFDKRLARKCKLSDGTIADEITYFCKTLNGRGHPSLPVLQVVTLRSVILPTAVLKAWSTIMLSEPKLGFPVMLRSDGLYHHLLDIDWKKRATGKGWRALVSYHSLSLKPISEKSFTIPSDYRRAHDISAFYLSGTGILKKGDIDDLFRGSLK